MTNPAWTWIASVLADAGCGLAVGLPSDEPGLLDAVASAGNPGMSALTVRDQRLGACALAGYWAVAGKPAVLATDSGPSFANAVTGLLETASLKVPAVVVTTRIAVEELRRGGFQQLDQVALAAPIAKWTVTIEQPEQLTWALRRAVYMAVNGLTGVVIVEIAREVLEAEAGWATDCAGPVSRVKGVASDEGIERAANLLADTERPVVIAGGGAKVSGAGQELALVAEQLGAAIFTTASGRGVIDENHPLACGLIGLYITPPAEVLLADADAILVVGSRLEETARMGWPGLHNCPVVQIDDDPAAFSNIVEPEVALLGDARSALARLAERLSVATSGLRVKAVKDTMRQRFQPASELNAATAVQLAVQRFGTSTLLIQENGLNDIWSYHYPITVVTGCMTVIAPGEQTMLGFGMGAALGACAADPSRPALLICGDGAVEMSLNALPTIAEQGFGLTIMMMDNRGYGWPRLARCGNREKMLTRFGQPSHADAVVTALGGLVFRPETVPELIKALDRARAGNAEGVMSLIAVPTADNDIPIGIRRVFPDFGAGDTT